MTIYRYSDIEACCNNAAGLNSPDRKYLASFNNFHDAYFLSLPISWHTTALESGVFGYSEKVFNASVVKD